MDRIELDEALHQAGVPESQYLILGIPRPAGPLQDPYYVLHEPDDGCLLTLQERGTTREIARFSTEDEACRFLFGQLTRPIPDPPPDSAEILADLMSRRDEIQRRAREQYDQARRDQD